MLVDELLAYLFEGQAHMLSAPMAAWLASSRRFADFVNIFRAKIRKKLRARQDVEGLLDLQLELETAYLLLQERSLGLVYEPQLAGGGRGPDFGVAHTSGVRFLVEVTRLRTSPGSTRALVQESSAARARSPFEERLADLVCGKLGQLLPQRTNVLLVGMEPPGPSQDLLRAGMLHLQKRAERDDPAIVQRRGFRDRADFFHHYQRLSELLVRGTPLQAGGPVIGWVNPQAKYPLTGKPRTAFHRSQSA